MKTIYLGRLGGLTISAKPNALIGLLIIWAVLSILGLVVADLPTAQALLAGLIGAVLHFASEMIHQFGHAAAAKRTGHAMKGIRFWWMLAQSIYPSDEPDLPPSVHVQRAMGGPRLSFAVALMIGVILVLLRANAMHGMAWWLAVFMFLDNLLVFTLGALLPLGFTDGSTLIRYWGK